MDIIHDLFGTVLDVINEGIILADSKFNIIFSNNYSTELFLEGSGLIELFPQLKPLILDLDQVIFKNRKLEVSINAKNFELTLNTLDYSNNFYHLVIIHQLQHKKDDTNINKHLIAYLSHELRNPLQSITLATHLLKTNPTKTNYIDTIVKSSYDMKRIINDILDLSKIDSNEFVIDMDICNINQLLDDIIEENIHEAELKNLTISKCISENSPKSLYTDITRISQILNNLITNAIKYSDKGNITIKVDYEENGVIFSVHDEGIGIRQEEMCNLFKTYKQTSNNNTYKVSSNGLGLCVSQKIANLLGGYITVKSEHKTGSIFSLFHPVNLRLSGLRNCSEILSGFLEGCVLLVDDNILNLSLLHTILEQFNYEYKWNIRIESANNGREAIELCKVNDYNIIFMDINMTGIDGYTTSKIIRNNNFKGKIIATTGNIDTNMNSFDDIIIKPFDDSQILKILRKNF